VTGAIGVRPEEPNRDQALMWRASDLGGLQLVRARYAHLTFRPHGHEEYMIAVTEHGRAALCYRGDTYPVGPGDIILLNPEEIHGGGPIQASVWRYRGLYPDGSLMRAVAGQAARKPGRVGVFSEHLVHDVAVAALLLQAHRAMEDHSSRLQRESLLLRALATLMTRYSADVADLWCAGAEREAVRRARDYLDAHAADEVTLTGLAEVAGLSPYHLCHAFRRDVGLPPHAYQIQARVRRAQGLLGSGMYPAEVAQAVGFVDQAHLTRHFKRIIGVTPGRYRSGRA
jgi:AraC-like DNA-binding protein